MTDHKFTIKKSGKNCKSGLVIVYIGPEVGWKYEYKECENCGLLTDVNNEGFKYISCDEMIIKNIIE